MFEHAKKRLHNLHHEIESTSKIILKSKKWFKISSATSKDCDIILTFPVKTSHETIDWLISLLKERVPELQISLKHHKKSNVHALYLTSSYKSLLRGAEALCLRKRLLPDFGGGIREFNLDEIDLFEDVTEEELFLTSQERQSIVRHWLYSLRAIEGDTIAHLTFAKNQRIVPMLLSEMFVCQIFPLHDRVALAKLSSTWIFSPLFNRQPVDAIQEYFGVKIALYFAWLGHYTVALLFPTIIGLGGWMLTGKENIDVYYLITPIFNLLWATLYLEHWKRTSSELTYRWATLDYQSRLLEEPRPLFRGVPQRCSITGTIITTYPEWKRNLILCLVSGPFVVLSLSLVVAITVSLSQTQTWVNDCIARESCPNWLGHVPKILLAISIGVLDDIYKRVALKLNALENHRLEEDYRRNLIAKLISFQFMNSFFSLFYIAFYLQDLERLRQQLATVIITRQFIGNAKEILIPFLTTKCRQILIGLRYERQKQQAAESGGSPNADSHHSHEASDGNGDGVRMRSAGTSDATCSSTDIPEPAGTPTESNMFLMSQAEEEATLQRSEQYDDPYEDYLEMFIQFGYVSMFSCAFPLAGLFCLVNNVMEVRSDAFKLTTSFQRNFGNKASSIGIWQPALEILSCIAVTVNIALLGVSGGLQRIWPQITTTQTILALVALEHAIIIAKLAIASAIPDIPKWVEHEVAKQEYKRREALKTLEKENFRERRRRRSESKSSGGGDSRDSSSQRPATVAGENIPEDVTVATEIRPKEKSPSPLVNDLLLDSGVYTRTTDI